MSSAPNNSLLRRFQSICGVAVLLLFIIPPFQNLLTTPLLRHGLTGKPLFLLSDWFEIVIFLIFLVAALLLAARQKLFSWQLIDTLAAAVLGISILTYLWAHHSIGAHVIGLRYSMLPIYAYFTARLSSQNLERYKTAAVWVFWGVLTLAIAQFLVWLFVKDTAVLYPIGWEKYHLAGQTARLYIPLNGPLQLGEYAMLAALFGYFWANARGLWLFLASGFVVLLTFSRGALLGVLSFFPTYFFGSRFSKDSKRMLLVLAGLVIIGVAFFGASQAKVKNIFVSGRPNFQRFDALHSAVAHLKNSTVAENIFGHSAGTAGPSTFVTGDLFIPENWFIQIWYEDGLLGLAAYLAFIVGLVVIAQKQKRYEITAVIVAMLIVCMFLHPLSDNPAATLLLFLTAGLVVNEWSTNEKNSH